MNVITVDREQVAILNHTGALREQDVNMYRRKFGDYIGHYNTYGIRIEAILEPKKGLNLWPEKDMK